MRVRAERGTLASCPAQDCCADILRKALQDRQPAASSDSKDRSRRLVSSCQEGRRGCFVEMVKRAASEALSGRTCSVAWKSPRAPPSPPGGIRTQIHCCVPGRRPRLRARIYSFGSPRGHIAAIFIAPSAITFGSRLRYPKTVCPTLPVNFPSFTTSMGRPTRPYAESGSADR